MAKPKMIPVRAAPGKIIPIVPGVAHNTAARAFTAENVVEVYAGHPLVRRALRAGDLVEAKKPSKAKPANVAASPAPAKKD